MRQRPDAATVIGTDGRPRCRWAAVTPEFPVRAELAHHSGQAREFSCCLRRVRLSGVANFDDNDIERLLADEGIVRYRGKIEAVINNARRTFEVVQEEGSFAAFIWLYEPCQGRRTATNAVQINSVRDPFQRPTKAWLQIRGTDHRICIHAGHGMYQRSRRSLLDAKGRRNSPKYPSHTDIGNCRPINVKKFKAT